MGNLFIRKTGRQVEIHLRRSMACIFCPPNYHCRIEGGNHSRRMGRPYVNFRGFRSIHIDDEIANRIRAMRRLVSSPEMPPQVETALRNRRGVEDLAKLEPLVPIRLSDEEALHDATYVPQDGDRRQVVERQIRERRGQQQFRDALGERYAHRCLVTGCDVLAVLEAAHINPYRVSNG